MPPKKTAAGAAVQTPATVTTSRGKEIETTAAAARPKRAAAAAPAPVKKTAATKATTKTKSAASATTTKKRGRPAKVTEEADEPPKKRGRVAKAETAVATPGKKRGSGRPAKKPKPALAPAVPLDEQAPPKARGAPPKGGETTKITAAEEAAAEQLEEELVDAVESDPSKPSTALKGKGKAVKTAGRGKQAAAQIDEGEEADAEGATGVGAQQYWLMKAEQEDREETLKDGSVFNAKFTIDDLRQKGGPEPWDGVRNAVACKNMKSMKVGDLAFFYASGGKAGRVPGITGIMEIVKEHEADVSAFDEDSPFYVDNPKMRGSAEKPRWFLVHVEFRKKLSKPVTLSELKKFAKEGSVLAGMQELTAARLSVSKVSQEEWNFIVNELIEGYEEDDSNDDDMAAKGPKHNHIEGVTATNGVKGVPIIPSLDGQESDLAEPESVSSNGAVAASSRAGSTKPASRAGSAKPASRAPSRDPTGRSVSRGRSRVRKGSVGATGRQAVTAPEGMEVIEE